MSFSLTIKTAQERAADRRAGAVAQVITAINAHVEARAQALGYNNAAACAGYRDSTVPAWAAEAQAFIAWRDAVWLAVYQLQGDLAEDGVVPGIEAILDALPGWEA